MIKLGEEVGIPDELVCGWVVWRDAEALPKDLIFNVDYLGGEIGTFAINFSRPAGQVISQYYEFIGLGRQGYEKVQRAAYEVAQHLAAEIGPLGPYEFMCTGSEKTGIPAVCFKLKNGSSPGYTSYDLSDRLRIQGWQAPAFELSGNASDIVVMRVMCRRGFEMDLDAGDPLLTAGRSTGGEYHDHSKPSPTCS